jgi:hypothetical protein
MSQVTIIRNSRPDIGLYTRSATLGDEYLLVEQFLEYYCHVFARNNKKNKLAVFVEPRIDSGFPDVVFASYLPSITKNWSYQREILDVYDLKLLSYLCSSESVRGKKLITTLGFSEKQTITSLEKLMDAKLVSYHDCGWKVHDLRDVFSLTKITAVEAKLNNINKVVEQTHRNTRFASHSYALTNSVHPQGETVKTFKRFGIGLYGKDSQFRRIVEARQFALPSSYLSFQLNEWVGKLIAHQGGTQHA